MLVIFHFNRYSFYIPEIPTLVWSKAKLRGEADYVPDAKWKPLWRLSNRLPIKTVFPSACLCTELHLLRGTMWPFNKENANLTHSLLRSIWQSDPIILIKVMLPHFLRFGKYPHLSFLCMTPMRFVKLLLYPEVLDDFCSTLAHYMQLSENLQSKGTSCNRPHYLIATSWIKPGIQ